MYEDVTVRMGYGIEEEHQRRCGLYALELRAQTLYFDSQANSNEWNNYLTANLALHTAPTQPKNTDPTRKIIP